MAILKRKTTAAETAEEAVTETAVSSNEATAAAPAKEAKKKAPKAKKEEATPARKANAVSTLAMRTILRPLATEKTAHLADRGVYAFLVAKDANRVAVRQAIRELYKVNPVKVNIIRVRGTEKRFGRFIGRTSDLKKALVTLPQGTHIDVFESV